jgi:hypothetical protein
MMDPTIRVLLFTDAQTRKDNQALDRYINARRKKVEARKKEKGAQKMAEEEARKKVMESQSSKDVRTWRK